MRVIVADDHPLFRDALVRLVAQIDPLARIDEAASLAAVSQLLEDETACELLLLDLRMPGVEGAASIAHLSARRPDVPIVVISASESPIDAQKVLAAGAWGCLRKSTEQSVLTNVIAGLLDGSGLDHPLLTDSARFTATRGSGVHLTPRQAEVLSLLCTGASNKVIARQLGLTEGTVKLHVAAIIQALQVRNRNEAASRARELGWI